MEARDPDDLPRILSYPLWLEFSSDPWPFFFFFFFRAKQACQGTEGLMEEFAAKMGEGPMEFSGLHIQEREEALEGSRILLKRSPQAAKAEIPSGWELFPARAH